MAPKGEAGYRAQIKSANIQNAAEKKTERGANSRNRWLWAGESTGNDSESWTKTRAISSLAVEA